MNISNISSTTNLTADSIVDSLGKDDFLKLLVTQLQYQDPLNPQDSAEFTAQLATFSSLEQLFSINEGMQNLQLLALSNANSLTLSLIGKEIVATGEAISLTDGVASTVSYKLSDDAESVIINIYDSSGDLIRTVDLGSQNDGEQEFNWDGRLDDGTIAADGEYTFEVIATDHDDASIDVNTYIYGIVSGIKFEDGLTYVIVDGRKIPVSEITEVNDVQL